MKAPKYFQKHKRRKILHWKVWKVKANSIWFMSRTLSLPCDILSLHLPRLEEIHEWTLGFVFDVSDGNSLLFCFCKWVERGNCYICSNTFTTKSFISLKMQDTKIFVLQTNTFSKHCICVVGSISQFRAYSVSSRWDTEIHARMMLEFWKEMIFMLYQNKVSKVK